MSSKYKITNDLLDKVRKLYPDCYVFESISEPDYIYIRKVIGKSKFYTDKKESFLLDITSLEKIHVAEVILDLNKL